MAGDLHAQMASGEVGAQRLNTLCAAHGLDDIEALADEIINRSEEATRDSIRGLPSGTYESSAVLDLADGSKIDIMCALTVDAELGEITVDYDGTSEASPWGINVVMNYTHAYTTFTVRSVLNPDIPNNHGSLGPIKVKAPSGSIVNAVSPQPGTARHVVGMFLPNALLKALAQGSARRSNGRRVRSGVDDAGQRQPSRRQSVHHGDVHLRWGRGCTSDQARAQRLFVPNRCVGGADRGGRGIRSDPIPRKVVAPRLGWCWRANWRSRAGDRVQC